MSVNTFEYRCIDKNVVITLLSIKEIIRGRSQIINNYKLVYYNQRLILGSNNWQISLSGL